MVKGGSGLLAGAGGGAAAVTATAADLELESRRIKAGILEIVRKVWRCLSRI